MSTKAGFAAASLTAESPRVDVAVCSCNEDEHRWSAPAVENVNTVHINRQRCTCPHCQCAALHLTVDPTDTGTPQHLAVNTSAPLDSDEVSSNLPGRVLEGLRGL